jgi:hypothetical protein
VAQHCRAWTVQHGITLRDESDAAIMRSTGPARGVPIEFTNELEAGTYLGSLSASTLIALNAALAQAPGIP